MPRQIRGDNYDLDYDPSMVDALVDQISPLLSAHHPGIVGATLATLYAMLLAGHQGEHAAEMREELLAHHIDAVRKLILIEEAMLLERTRHAAH